MECDPGLASSFDFSLAFIHNFSGARSVTIFLSFLFHIRTPVPWLVGFSFFCVPDIFKYIGEIEL